MDSIKLILWKNFIIKLRRPTQLAIELGVPCAFFMFLAILRSNILSDINKPSVKYPRFQLFEKASDVIDRINQSTTFNIMYTPETNQTKEFFDVFLAQINSSKLKDKHIFLHGNVNVKGFNNESDMIKYYHVSDMADISLGIVVQAIDKTNLNIRIRMPQTIRMTSMKALDLLYTLKWQTEHVFPITPRAGPREIAFKHGGEPSYYEQGVLALQQLFIYTFLAKYYPSKLYEFIDSYNISMGRMPYPDYKDDTYMTAVKFFLPMIFVVSFIFPMSNIAKTIVSEKEQRFTSIAAMMGLSQSVQWMAHFITAFLFNSISVAIIVFLLKFSFVNDVKVLQYSSASFLFFWFLIYVCNFIAFAFFISTLFSESNMASVVAGAVFFISFLPYYHITLTYSTMPWFTKIAFSFILNLNMSFGCILLSLWELQATGLQWSNFLETPQPEDGLAMAHLCYIQVITFVLYILLGIYISNVFPGQYGTPKEWDFFLKKNYWTSSDSIDSSQSEEKSLSVTATKTVVVQTSREKSRARTSTTSVSGSEAVRVPARNGTQLEMTRLQQAISKINPNLSMIYCQSSQSSIEPSMNNQSRIINLYKTYDKGKTFAVKNLSMLLEQNEITVLLGHNGAGKSTLMNMLCGMITPSTGEITIFGNDIHNVNAIRKDMGICLQFDVLFEDMTVKEHLYFYSVLKQVHKSRIEPEIKSIIEMLQFQPKVDSLSKTLSGGMKRKLCVGIALIGGSKFVILDEPTSGMDVSARRFIWDLLLKEKKGRIILMSTHFMEEADVLGDKIAIMEAGQLKCFGTPMELKKKYGQGYLLSIALKDQTPEDIRTKIVDLISTSVQASKIVTSISNELTFSLPESQSKNFKNLFTNLEKNSESLSILNFGISISTLEEVFLNVGEFAKEGIKHCNEYNSDLSKTKKENSLAAKLKISALTFNDGWLHRVQVFWAMMAKKQYFICNSYFFVFSLCVLPPFILILSLLLNKNGSDYVKESPERLFDVQQYRRLTFHSFLDESRSCARLETIMESYLKILDFDKLKFIHERKVNSNNIDDYLISKGQKNVLEYSNNHLFATLFETNTKTGGDIVTGLFSNEAYHSAPTLLVLLNIVLLKDLLKIDDMDIRFSLYPMPPKVTENLNLLTMKSLSEVQLCFALTFAVSFLMASFVIIIVSELSSNFRHIQQISGLSLKCFWTTHFLLDYIYWIIGSAFLSFVVFLANIEPYNSAKESGFILISISLLGFPALPFIYVLSFTVRDPAAGFVRVSLYTCILGTVSFLGVVILRVPLFNLQNFSTLLENILQYFIPIFTMPSQTFAIGKNRRAAELCKTPILFRNKNFRLIDFCDDKNETIPGAKMCCEAECGITCYIEKSFWDWSKPGTLQFIVGYIVQTFFYWTLIYLVEKRKFFILWCKLPTINAKYRNSVGSATSKDSSIDSDVRREKERILTLTATELAETDAMWATGLSKKYGNFVAVDNIFFGVKKAECFGILGTNGAGKTTTFKMITGAETLTSGNIIINKMSVLNKMTDIYKYIGYCPQFNGLLEEFTGRQTLWIISRIRGIQEKLIEPQIDVLAKLFFFEKHIDKRIYTYSGGTKRKLSMACSIVGNPMLVFLDEPSTGVDPVSRRCLWNGVQALRAAGSSVILTSHSMEECEALCNRLMIMVNARVRCLGSPLHLKCKFGTGYVIQIKCKRLTKRTTIHELIGNVVKRFGNKVILESNHNKQLTFNLKTNNIPLSKIFGFIEELKNSNKYKIEDYSVGQTSLERIFLSFAREQVDKKS